jgi:hypothetical protein
MDPAPGYDDDIPHDLVHYVVEAELGLTHGVYGRAARGGGTFLAIMAGDRSPLARARQQREQQKRERALNAHDAEHRGELARSKRWAALCDVVWRRQHGQQADPRRRRRRRRCGGRGSRGHSPGRASASVARPERTACARLRLA